MNSMQMNFSYLILFTAFIFLFSCKSQPTDVTEAVTPEPEPASEPVAETPSEEPAVEPNETVEVEAQPEVVAEAPAAATDEEVASEPAQSENEETAADPPGESEAEPSEAEAGVAHVSTPEEILVSNTVLSKLDQALEDNSKEAEVMAEVSPEDMIQVSLMIWWRTSVQP